MLHSPLGATKWETIKKGDPAQSLAWNNCSNGISDIRAFGETIAVLMVCGNNATVPHSVFDPGYPLPALIANNLWRDAFNSPV